MTITEIYNIIKNIQASHLQLKDTFVGAVNQAMAQDVVLEYPAVIASVTNVNYSHLKKSLTLNLIFIDKLDSGEKNLLFLENDLELICSDFYKVLTTSTYKEKFNIVSATSQKVADRLKDNVIGWSLVLELSVNDGICATALPFTSEFINNLKL